MIVSPKRHIAKTITYRILSSSIGSSTIWFATGSIKFGLLFVMLELVWKPLQYFIHERIWYKFIKYGINSNPTETITDKPNTSKVIENSSVTTTKRLIYSKRTD